MPAPNDKDQPDGTKTAIRENQYRKGHTMNATLKTTRNLVPVRRGGDDFGPAA